MANPGLAVTWPVGSLVQVELVDGQGLRWQYACKVAWQADGSIGLALPPQAPIPDEFLTGDPVPVQRYRSPQQTGPLPASIRLSPFSRRTLIVSPAPSAVSAS